jgi:hypothetical protein
VIASGLPSAVNHDDSSEPSAPPKSVIGITPRRGSESTIERIVARGSAQILSSGNAESIIERQALHGFCFREITATGGFTPNSAMTAAGPRRGYVTRASPHSMEYRDGC